MVKEEAEVFLKKAIEKQASFEKDRISRPIPENISEKAAQVMREMITISNTTAKEACEDVKKQMTDYRDRVLSILGEEEKLTQASLAKELSQLNLHFDVAEINMEQNLSDTIKFLMDSGYPLDEATTIATKIHEDALKKKG